MHISMIKGRPRFEVQSNLNGDLAFGCNFEFALVLWSHTAVLENERLALLMGQGGLLSYMLQLWRRHS